MGVGAGYLANWIKKWKVHRYIKPVMPFLIIPIITAVTVGLVYIYFLATPLGGLVVLPVVGNALMYIGAVLAGVATVVVLMYVLKKDIVTFD